MASVQYCILFLGFPGGAVVKNLPASAGDTRDEGSILKSGRSPGAGNGNHSSILAGIIPWTEESGGLQSRGGHKELGTTEHTHTHTHTLSG